MFETLFEVKRMQYSAIRIDIIGTYRTDTMQLIFLTYSEIQRNTGLVMLVWLKRYPRCESQTAKDW